MINYGIWGGGIYKEPNKRLTTVTVKPGATVKYNKKYTRIFIFGNL